MDDFAIDSPYHYLLDDPDFSRFIQNVRRRAEDSALQLVRLFGLIHRRFKKLPKAFAKMDTRQAKRFLLDMIDDFETKGGEEGEDLTGSYIQNYVKAVNRWFDFNDITPPRKVAAEGADESVLPCASPHPFWNPRAAPAANPVTTKEMVLANAESPPSSAVPQATAFVNWLNNKGLLNLDGSEIYNRNEVLQPPIRTMIFGARNR
jgi:hypothetical protein